MTAAKIGAAAGMLVFGLGLLTGPASAQGERLLLRVHDSGRYLVDGEGAPSSGWGIPRGGFSAG